jgi:hypothetical protein
VHQNALLTIMSVIFNRFNHFMQYNAQMDKLNLGKQIKNRRKILGGCTI